MRCDAIYIENKLLPNIKGCSRRHRESYSQKFCEGTSGTCVEVPVVILEANLNDSGHPSPVVRTRVSLRSREMSEYQNTQLLVKPEDKLGSDASRLEMEWVAVTNRKVVWLC